MGPSWSRTREEELSHLALSVLKRKDEHTDCESRLLVRVLYHVNRRDHLRLQRWANDAAFYHVDDVDDAGLCRDKARHGGNLGVGVSLVQLDDHVGDVGE